MNPPPIQEKPGLIVLFGSGETSPTGRRIFAEIFPLLPSSPRLALLETPAGFEPNSAQVIGRVGLFFEHRFQNYDPKMEIIPARKRGSDFSPDNLAIVDPILQADMIFMGPGSPSYTVRQLCDSLAWDYILARHLLGAVLSFASAAAIAIGALALPVYEIFKAGEDLHWINGLDFFGAYGLQLIFIPHWNNHEGGSELDTSCCFMGRERFEKLMKMLPDDVTIIGLDEKTALILDPSSCQCQVRGQGKVTVLRRDHTHSNQDQQLYLQTSMTGGEEDLYLLAEQQNGYYHQYMAGEAFSMNELGPFHPFIAETHLPLEIWQKAILAKNLTDSNQIEIPPREIVLLIQARQQARQAQNWLCADKLRKQIERLGWEVQDTRDGPVCKKLSN